MSGRKKLYFHSIDTGFNIVCNINNEKEYEKYIFYTSFGTIVGRPKELIPLDLKNEEATLATLTERLKNKEPIDAISIGNSFYLNKSKELFKKEENDVEDNIAIALEDVVITDNNGIQTNSNIFMLYFDQVIGFMPFSN